MNDFTLTLAANETQFLLNVLGELPSRTGAYLLLTKIKDQCEAQMPKDEIQVTE